MACDGRTLRQRGSASLFLLLFLTSFVSLVLTGSDAVNGRPNIIFIMADDLGWNDVGFHGSNQIPTPNIDSLAYSGIILNNYYVTPICTPSRSALMTGKHPIHTGMQHTVLFGAEPRGLPLSEKILPEYLKELGYSNHIVGKWHLGHYKREYTPLYRGFDSHIGFWTGHQDYYDHTAMEQQMWGLDMRRGLDVAWDLHGQYSTEIFARESVNVINSHNKSSPLFLYLAHTAVHSGNPYTPLRAPDNGIDKFGKIDDYQRRKFAAMVTEMDDSVGRVVQALDQNDMLSNSIIIFSSDNGGPAAGFNINAASNYPLRGVKNTLWEGGVRAAGLIWSPLINERNRVANQLFHVSDWLPTLYAAAGGKKELVFKDEADGKNQWKPLSEDLPSKRSVVLHNIDDIWRSASLISGNWKIHKGTNYNGEWDGWYGPAGREGSYQTKSLEECPAARALKKLNLFPTEKVINSMRNKATITCKKETPSHCNPLIQLCLYNIEHDPCEERNLAESEPAKLQELVSLLAAMNATAVPPGNLPLDPQGNPKFWNYTWTNFGDYLSEHVTLQM